MKHDAEAFADTHDTMGAVARRGLQNALILGFDDATRAKVSGVLRQVSLIPHAMDEPYTAMQTMTDDPGSWMTCILDVASFSDDIPLERYLRLLGHHEHRFGVILGNAPAGMQLDGLTDTAHRVDATLLDITRRDHLIFAIRTVLRRREFSGQTVEDTLTHAMTRPPECAAAPRHKRNRPTPLSVKTRNGSATPPSLDRMPRRDPAHGPRTPLDLVPLLI